MKNKILCTTVPVLLLAITTQAQTTYTPLNAPGAGTANNTVSGTYVQGISGNTTVGYYINDAGTVYTGYSAVGGVYTTLADPAAGSAPTLAYGIDANNPNNIVGHFGNSTGFLYQSGVYTSLVEPLAVHGTWAQGISGNTVVGYYKDSSFNLNAFSYSISSGTYTTINDPLASVGGSGTEALGVDGNTIVGTYYNGSTWLGFEDIGGVYTTVQDPLGTDTYVTGVSGNGLVGYYHTATAVYGFYASGTNFITLSDPNGTNITYATGIDGTNVVGYSQSSATHGWQAGIDPAPAPEPGMLALCSLGGLGSFFLFRRRKQ